jgi:hypothetical protein
MTEITDKKYNVNIKFHDKKYNVNIKFYDKKYNGISNFTI